MKSAMGVCYCHPIYCRGLSNIENYADFRPANILVRLTNLDHLSEAELLNLLADPTTAHVRTVESLQDYCSRLASILGTSC